MDFLKNPHHLLLLNKRLRRYYRNETGYSITLSKMAREDKRLFKPLAKIYLPAEINYIINIMITLERHFDIPRQQAITTAADIYKKKLPELEKYQRRWFDFGDGEQRLKPLGVIKALKEQIARGFQHKFEITLDPDLPYIRSNIDNDVIWPIQYPNKKGLNLGGIYEKFEKIGVTGHTGIVLPKRINGR